MKDNTVRRVVVVFLLISAVLIGVAVTALRNLGRAVGSNDAVNQTHAIILESQGLLAALQAGTGAVHTFALTGHARDEAAARQAFNETAEHLEVATALTRRVPAQQAQIAGLATLVNQHLALAGNLMAARRTAPLDSAAALLGADTSTATLAEIKRRIDRLRTDAMAQLAERDRESYLQAQATRWTVWCGVVLDVLLLSVVAWLVREDVANRRRLATTLQAANQQLESRVQERTRALAAANSQLSADNLERRWSNQALEHQLRYNHLIINSLTDLVLVLTKALNISRINPAVTHLTGFTPQDLINRPWSQLLQLDHVTTDAPLIDPVRQALKDGRELRDQPATLNDQRGRRIPVRFSLIPLRDADVVVGGVLIIHQALSAERSGS